MSRNKLLRVTQINAVYFDKEIRNILQEQVTNILRYLPPGLLSRYQPELNFSINLAIFYYSIIKCDKTFGQKLLSLQYSSMSNKKKILYLFGNVYHYVQERVIDLAQPNLWLFGMITMLNNILIVAKFVNISLFLRNGKYPTLKERILGLEHEYVNNNVQRYYSSKYMARELLWNGLIEILVYLLPLINYHKITRVLRHINPLNDKMQSKETVENPIMNHSTKCTYCKLPPVNPHHMGCSHLFCYVCLKGNQIADEKYECPVCCTSNPYCKKVYLQKSVARCSGASTITKNDEMAKKNCFGLPLFAVIESETDTNDIETGG